MAYNINEIQLKAQKLQLQKLEDTCSCAIEGLNNVSKNLKLLVLTTHGVIGKDFLKEYFELAFNATMRLSPCEIHCFFGDNQYTIDTNYGEINVDETTFLNHLSSQSEEILRGTMRKQLSGNNIEVDFLFVNDFSTLSHNEWIMRLSSVDKIYYLLDGLQILNEKEKEFGDVFVNTLFADKRNAFVIGNSQYLDESERTEVLEYSKRIIGEKCNILISDEEKPTFDALNNDISNLESQVIEIRSSLEPSITNYFAGLLCDEAARLKDELTNRTANLEESIALISSDSQIVEKSKAHIKQKIDSYIREYAYILFEKRVNGFNRLLIDSLSQDINQSKNIDEDAKWVNKYLEFIWSKFMAEQESWLKSTILNEVTDIESIISTDLNMLVNQLDVESQRLIKEYVLAKYSVHSFLVNKEGKTSVGELSKTLKLGSVVMAIFSPLLAIISFGGSELVKKLFNTQFTAEKKDNLITSVVNVSKQMVDQILQQADNQFGSIANRLKEQTMEVYDNLLSELTNVLTSKQHNASEIEEMLSLIGEIENEYSSNNNN